MSINPEVWEWAKWASEKTGIPAEIIYAQWSLEAGEERIQNPASLNYNLAGLTVAGKPGVWRKYSSLAEFAWDYVYSFLLLGYPQAIGAKDIKSFVTGLKYGKWGSYYGEESIESYGSKLTSRYKLLFGNVPGEDKAIWEGQTIGPDTRPKWRRVLDDFIYSMKKKLGLVKPEWEQELEAREYVIEKAKEKGIPVSPKFEKNTQILRDWKEAQERAKQTWIEKLISQGMQIVIGLILILVGVIVLVYNLSPREVLFNAGNKSRNAGASRI